MAKPSREGHVEETLRRILAATLTTEAEDPLLAQVTISEVRLNRDRTVATVFYTVMGEEDDRRAVSSALSRAGGFLRQRIGEQTRLRSVPELRFRFDSSLDRSFHVEGILERLERERQERERAAEASPEGSERPERGENDG